jgi:signal transduction histidine kinase
MDLWLERFARANFRRSADTAHDLKTPLNVAVLNLELLRMRLSRLVGEDDQKVREHAQAIELELRRMGRIFDAFFLLSTPPAGEAPARLDASQTCREAAERAGIAVDAAGPLPVEAHPARIAEMFRLFFGAAAKIFAPANRTARFERRNGSAVLELAGVPATEIDAAKLFKLYYTDREGNPDLSLAVARLIAETYGGDLAVEEGGGSMELRLTLPLGER